MESNIRSWPYEICKWCGKEQRLSWSVTHILWKRIMGESNVVVCLECFLKEADCGGIKIKKEDFMYLGWINKDEKGDVIIDRTC